MPQSSRASTAAQNGVHWIQLSLLLDFVWLTNIELVIDSDQQNISIWVIAILLAISMGFDALQSKALSLQVKLKDKLISKAGIYVIGALALVSLVEIGLYFKPFLDGKAVFAVLIAGALTTFKTIRLFSRLRKDAKTSAKSNHTWNLSGLEVPLLARLAALACIALPIGGTRLALWLCCALLSAKR